MHVKKGDNVIIAVMMPAKRKNSVEKKKYCHSGKCKYGQEACKPRKAGQPGGIVDFERPVNASNVMLVCPKCKEASKTKMTFDKDGNKQRTCKKCGAVIDKVSAK